MAVTLADVARAAEVSTSTVSRALTQPERVDERTRARILDTARRLGYRPNRAARSLITGRTGNLGVIVPDLTNPFFPDVVAGIQARAHQRALTTLLADTGDDPDAERDLIATLAPQVDGLVLCGARLPVDDLADAVSGSAVVLVNRSEPGLASVAVDNAGGARQAVEHLHALGHRRIGLVAGPATSHSARERSDGARRAAAALGVDLVEVGTVAPTFDGGRGVADAVLRADVSAVVAYNDAITIGLLHRLHGYGVRIPAELSVVGFDDIQIAQMAHPPLTTVRFPRREAGRLAVDRLLDLLAGERDPGDEPEPLPTELVVRASTAVHRSRTT
ncbi:LacI family DNA-binding transcriptional regulator [Cryptosporangium minutisporangium]|uniref:LacI family DNA-binding transcriptional regulator n=1 Tax=Cryptosporangium minutisporangium TaxID=113569 RepID=A0ABP6T2S7_9ACTN